MRYAHSVRLALFASIAASAICCSSVAKQDQDLYPKASPFVDAQVEQQLLDVPYLKGRQIVDACATIVRIGPAAIPKLKIATQSDDPNRRIFALNVLGAMGDRRVLETIHVAAKDPDPSVRYEAARACTRMGDWSLLGVLIDGLEDSSPYARTLCNDALRKNTSVDFGFQPQGDDKARAESVGKWRTWWSEHQKATLDLRS